MSEFTLTRVDRIRYRPSRSAFDFLDRIRSNVFSTDRATVGRLAIARSLHEPSKETDLVLPDGTEMGNPIEGVHLFGEDHDVWACLIGASVSKPIEDGNVFKALVEAHWHRGAMLLKDDYADVGDSDVDFVLRLANLSPTRSGAGGRSGGSMAEAAGSFSMSFGSTSTDAQSGEAVRFSVNAPGTSPHMAIMGKTRSGKSRTGLDVASELIKSANLPLILIDPKGEFVNDGKLVAKPEWQGDTLDRYFPGIRPLDIPETRIPLDFLYREQGASDADLAKLAASFRDSFQKCLKSRGDVALNLLRETVVELLRSNSGPVSLRNVKDGFAEATEQAGKAGGSIAAKLSEIEALGLFAPTMAPSEFFSRRWVVSFGSCSDEPKRLSIFLLLDALNSYMLSTADSGMDAEGYRSLRHLLVVDEAREILSYKHGALSSLIRKSASKGGVTMLLSQGPDDFDHQEDDDFLEQMGTVGVFALSSSNVRSLTGTFGRKMKVEDFADKALPAGTALVKMPGQGTRKVVAWK